MITEEVLRKASKRGNEMQRETIRKAKVKELFEAVREVCPEVYTPYENYEGKMIADYGEIQLPHLLRTAEARGIRTSIDSKGQLFILIGTCWTFVCKLDLTKSLENQEEDTLIQLANVIL